MTLAPSTPGATGWPTVLACGAWLKNSACLLQDGQALWSAPHGDLSDPCACTQLARSVEALLARSSTPVQAVAHDLHPDFFSTRLAVEWAQRLGVPAVAVQHHHAHIAAVAADHGLNGPMVGLALDGVGLGSDGTAWGGELLWLHGAEWQRLGHLSPLSLPGGDKAATEPWRMAASALHALGRDDEVLPRLAPLAGTALAQGVQGLLRTQLNCPVTTSAGRWFDAAAGALWQPLGLGLRQTHEAQAAMALQAAASRWLSHYAQTVQSATAARPTDAADPSAAPGWDPALAWALGDDAAAQAAANDCAATDVAAVARLGPDNTLDLRPLLAALLDAPASQADAAAAHFHLALADGLARWAASAALAHGTQVVALGGGCWFNALLRQRVVARLRALGLAVLLPSEQAHGCGDAGLALGQAWVAAQQLAPMTPLAPPFAPTHLTHH